MFRFLHAADLHLDSPLRGLDQYDGAPVDEIRQASRRSLENIVQTAIDRQVQFVVIAGDVFDGDWRDHNTGLFFVAQMTQLANAGIPVVMIAGNHDAASVLSRTIRLPEGVRLLGHDRPESIEFDDWSVAIHGQSFAEKAVHDNLAANYPAARSGCFNIGLLHTCLEDADHEPYAPCKAEELRNKGYQYWALGHVHTRSDVDGETDGPPIVFPGNIQGRHIRESGAKGCVVVSVDDLHKPSVEFVATDVFRWEVCEVDATDCKSTDDLLERFAEAARKIWESHESMPTSMRVVVQGRTSLHDKLSAGRLWMDEIRQTAIHVGGGRIWVEKVQVATLLPERGGADEAAVEHAVDMLGEYFSSIRSEESRSRLLDLGQSLDPLKKKLPAELEQAPEFQFKPNDSEWLTELLKEVEPMLRGRLLEAREGR